MDLSLKEDEEKRKVKKVERDKHNLKVVHLIIGCIASKHVQHYLKENGIKVLVLFKHFVWWEIVLIGTIKESIYLLKITLIEVIGRFFTIIWLSLDFVS